ncbi:MAG: hypothetical protein KBH94_03235 [Caldisericia bacterium]|nr:hypothetical protein [Caldisericia bacterium]
MENGLESYKEKENILAKYIKQIDELRAENKKDELEKLLNNVINFLPENVKSLSIPITANGETTFITKERESSVPEEEQEEWNLGILIEYSIREEGLVGKHAD